MDKSETHNKFSLGMLGTFGNSTVTPGSIIALWERQIQKILTMFGRRNEGRDRSNSTGRGNLCRECSFHSKLQ